MQQQYSMTITPSKILIATRNQGKIKEIRDLLKDLPVVLLSLADVTDVPEVAEDGATFEQNALKKARIISATTGLTTLTDDSGLCIDALDGRPGVRSARYAGDKSSDRQKWEKVLHEMKEVPGDLRSAQFVCVLALVDPVGTEKLFRGTCEGVITREPRGRGGFGYDPIFYFKEARLTFAEMDMQSKNLVSHRGRALRLFSAFLRQSVSS